MELNKGGPKDKQGWGWTENQGWGCVLLAGLEEGWELQSKNLQRGSRVVKPQIETRQACWNIARDSVSCGFQVYDHLGKIVSLQS